MAERIGMEEGRLLAQDEFARSLEELKAAKVLHERDFYFKSISSAYFSVYHAAKALLLLKGVTPKSHEGVERMFSLYCIKTGKVPAPVGKLIGKLMKLREESDFYPEAVFDENESSEVIAQAGLFLDEMRRHFPIGHDRGISQGE